MHFDYTVFGDLARISEPTDTVLLDDVDASSTEPGRRSTEFEYDGARNEIALIDARGNRTVYLKDDLDRVVVHHSPDTGMTRYRYDASGNRIEMAHETRGTTTYEWDVANRMTEKKRPDGVYRYAYHPVNGRLRERA